MELLINIDVDDLARATAFYTESFGLRVSRRFGEDVVELSGWPVPVYLLRKPSGSIAAADCRRSYRRHWTPVHLDVVVQDIEAALARAVGAGAIAETGVRTEAWGRIAILADPFGHGLCIIEFSGLGYDAIADRPA